MDDGSDLRNPPEFVPEDAIDEVFGHANPNQKRTGCPSHATLIALAQRNRPIDDAGYQHLATCSPCYREFRAPKGRSEAPQARHKLTP